MKGKYESHVKDKLTVVQGWARAGLIDKQIAQNLGVSYSTFKEYKKKYPDLATALKNGKEVVDFEVENMLFKRAMGYEYVETKVKVYTDDLGNITGKETTTINKHIAPDTTAQIFWLKNRKPTEWRTNPEPKIKSDEGVIKFEFKRS